MGYSHLGRVLTSSFNQSLAVARPISSLSSMQQSSSIKLSSQTTTCYPSRGTKKESAQSPTLNGQVLRRILMRTLLTTRILTKRTAISSQDLVSVMIRRVKRSKHTLIRRHTSTQAQPMKSMRHLGVGARVGVSLQGKSRHTR